MNSANSGYSPMGASLDIEIQVDLIARWDVYFHLQELSIPCECKHGQPLWVKIDNATAAIQVWSAIQAFTASKQSQVTHLQQCWQQKIAT